jgi:hypothetical protein
MMPNAQGNTTVPLGALQTTTLTDLDVNGKQVSETLPGLASICANQTYYPNNCSGDPNGQCGCVPSDFTAILANDPLLKFTPTENPLSADKSGAAACANPTAADSCRYVAVMNPQTDIQEVETLQGPAAPGDNNPANTFTLTDTNTSTTTYSESNETKVGYTWKINLLGSSWEWGNTFTWSDSESTGKINGVTDTITVTLNSSTVGCDESILLFEDTVYHTFVFQQPTGNNTCP